MRFVIKLLECFSKRLASKVVFSLFKKTVPGKVRKVEETVMNTSQRDCIMIYGKKVACYQWGTGKKTVVLVHGWNSRASRFYKVIDGMVKSNFKVVSYDLLGHGESEGNTASLLEGFEILKELQKKHGEFEIIISHSLGSLYSFYALKNGINAKKIIAISSVCKFDYLTFRFASYFGLKKETITLINQRIEKVFQRKDIWQEFSADNKADEIQQNVFLIHDEDDHFVEKIQSEIIYDSIITKKELFLTQKLGHNRILSEDRVVNRIVAESNDSDFKKTLLEGI